MSVGSEIKAIQDQVFGIASSLKTYSMGSWAVGHALPPAASVTTAGTVDIQLPKLNNAGPDLKSLDSSFKSDSDKAISSITAVAFDTIDAVDTSGSPDKFGGKAPTFDAGQAPESVSPDRDSIIGPAPQDINVGGAPDAPDIDAIIGKAPVLLAAAKIPAPPNLSDLPQFSATLPDKLLLKDLPSASDNAITNFDLAGWLKDPYQSTLLSKLTLRLSDDITIGRLGVPAEMEDKIWKRQLERNQMALDTGIRRINEEYSRAGFGLPPGKRDAKVRELVVTGLYAKNDSSRDIAYKQAELAQAWQQFAISQGVTIEQAQMGYVQKVAELALRVAETTVSSSINIFNAYVSAFNAQLEQYKSEAQVYETKLRAFMSRLEIYKSELEAAKIHNSLRKDDIELYTLRISQAEMFLKIYSTQMQSFVEKINLQKLSYDLYSKKVDTYKAVVDGYSSEWGGYRSRIEAEVGKQQGYVAEIEAHKSSVSVYEARLRAESTRVQAQASANSAKAEQLRGYVAQLEAYIKQYSAGISAYGSGLDVASKLASLEYDKQRTNIDLDYKAQALALQDKQIMAGLTGEFFRGDIEEMKSQQSMDVAALEAAGKLYQSAFNSQFNGVLGTYKATP